MTLTKYDGTPLTTEPASVKVRLSQVYKAPGDSISDMMAQIKSLTEDDLNDFRQWFAAAGYPCT